MKMNWLVAVGGIAGAVILGPPILHYLKERQIREHFGYLGRHNYIANSPVYGHQYPPIHLPSHHIGANPGRHNNIGNSPAPPAHVRGLGHGSPALRNPSQKDIHEIHGVQNRKHMTDTDPYDFGIPTPLKGIPMHIDTWRGTGGHNRIMKQVVNNARLYGRGCYLG
jgi:hypothetical protein